MADPTSFRERLKRAGERALRAGEDSRAQLVRRLPGPAAAAVAALGERAGGALLARMGERAEALSDLVATRLLETDTAASELAWVIEEAVEREGHPAVVRRVLRRSPLLDGTLLPFLDTLFASGPTMDFDPQAMAAARRNLALLVAELHVPAADGVGSARDDAAGPAQGEESGEAMDRLSAGDLPDRLPALYRGLRGEGDAEEQSRFVLLSYGIFLQAFLLRTAARSASSLLSARSAASREVIALDPTPDPKPT